MKEQRAFWISGLASLAVVVLMGSALWARSEPEESTFFPVAPAAVSASVDTQTNPEQDALRKELEVAYSDLDAAYREIERLQAAGSERAYRDDDDDDKERRGERHEHENEEHE